MTSSVVGLKFPGLCPDRPIMHKVPSSLTKNSELTLEVGIGFVGNKSSTLFSNKEFRYPKTKVQMVNVTLLFITLDIDYDSLHATTQIRTDFPDNFLYADSHLNDLHMLANGSSNDCTTTDKVQMWFQSGYWIIYSCVDDTVERDEAVLFIRYEGEENSTLLLDTGRDLLMDNHLVTELERMMTRDHRPDDATCRNPMLYPNTKYDTRMSRNQLLIVFFGIFVGFMFLCLYSVNRRSNRVTDVIY